MVVKADPSTEGGRLALEMVMGSIELLNSGQVPTWTKYRVPLDAPTQIHDTLRTEFDVLEAQAEEAARPIPHFTRIAPARLPIPARPLSYRAMPPHAPVPPHLLAPPRAHARRTDPATSHEAALSVVKITETHQRILVMLGNHPGGATDEELLEEWAGNTGSRYVAWPKITASGLRTRRKELVDMGKVVDSGHKGTTAAGRACVIWRLADG